MNSFLKDFWWAASRVILIGLVTVTIALIIGVSIYFYNFENIDCPNYQNLSSEWFPYKKNQKLVFQSNSKFDTLIVSEYANAANDSYTSGFRSGCCEEYVQTKLESKTNTLSIYMTNFDNPNSCVGFTLKISNQSTEDRKLILDTLSNGKAFENIDFNETLVIKNIGIVSFTRNGNTWSLQQ